MSEERPNMPESILPYFDVDEVMAAFVAYGKMQRALDGAMGDQIQTLGSGGNAKRFHKMGYWRAMAMAYGVEVRLESERTYQDVDGLAVEVTYKAIAPDGRSAVGDGSCTAIEKQIYKKDWDGWEAAGKPRGGVWLVKDDEGNPVIDDIGTIDNASLHNVRGHAHTRAKNRAIGELLAFGEMGVEIATALGEPGEPVEIHGKTSAKKAPAKKATPKNPPRDDKFKDAFETAMKHWTAKLSKAKWDGAYSLAWKWSKGKECILQGVSLICLAMDEGASMKSLKEEVARAKAMDVDSLKATLALAVAGTKPESKPKMEESALDMGLDAITERAQADGATEAMLKDWRLEAGISLQDEKTHTEPNLAKLHKKAVTFGAIKTTLSVIKKGSKK